MCDLSSALKRRAQGGMAFCHPEKSSAIEDSLSVFW